MPYHAIAVQSGGRTKTIPNKNEDELLSQIVLPFMQNGVIAQKWGKELKTYQVLELKIYFTNSPWNKKVGTVDDLIKGKKNCFKKFKDKAELLLAYNMPRVFVVTPIQGKKHGDQDQQRVYGEYDKRFQAVEEVLSDCGAVAIRIDKEHPLEDLVGRIKTEIRRCAFVVADLTDERPSCYFEVGYAEGLDRHVIYMASEQSVLKPGSSTKIHFDIHRNVLYFSNHEELRDKLKAAVEKNKRKLFADNDCA
jgi:hypothetical protein